VRSATSTSRVWYTVADGVLSDVYEPNVDTTNVETMQFIVSDGATFTDLQSRDMTYTVSADPTGMVCTVTSRARNYKLTTTYTTDPARDSVLVRTRFDGPSNLHLYVRLDPTVGGHGGGGPQNAGADSATADRDALVAGDPTAETAAANRDYAQPTYLALEGRFTSASAGYAGTASDGLTQLDTARHLTEYDSAPNGNVVLTGEIRRDSDLALGFGRTADAARSTAAKSLRTPYFLSLARYLLEWVRYDAKLERPPLRHAVAYYTGINVVKASEDKQFPGAIAAGLASPWGQAVAAGNLQDGKAPYFGSYREVFSRDLYEAFTALLVAGDLDTARDTARFLLERQQLADGRLPRNSLPNGKAAPDTGGDQLDETADPILMAYQSGLAHDRDLYTDHIRKAADFLVAHGPSFGNERWEEQGGYSPSTIAAEIAGLVAAGKIAATQHDDDRAQLYLATADHFQRSIKGWTVTTSGPYAPRYFIRLSRTGDPNGAIVYNLGNGSIDADQRAIVDQGFLELTRLGALSPNDPDVKASLAVVDRIIRRTTPNGDAFYRYGTDAAGSEDGYGDCHVPDPTNCSPEGKPWPGDNHGSGHLWPVLAGERAEQQLQTGDARGAAALLGAMEAMASGVGLVPEQTWEDPVVPPSLFGSDPQTASIGFAPGEPAGSAAPLTWAQAQEVRLILSLDAGRPLERPAAVRDRYKSPPGEAPLTVTAPAKDSTVTATTTHVTGTTAPRARVVVEATNTDTGAPSAVVAVTADRNGAFDVTVPTTFGTSVITTTATTPTATAYDQRRVASDAINGTAVFDTNDPAGDDHGPGTFQYPTSGDFHDGAFDLLRFQVIDGGDTIYLRTTLRDLTPTFGDPLGAQLLTIFARNPADANTTTAAFFTSRHYTVDPWNRGIQVRGFEAPRFVDARFTSLGPISVRAGQVTRTITILVPKAAFGTPGAGWTWNVILHGQDGFGEDGARTFADTPQTFQFGRCATATSTDPRCQVPSNQLPKAMDVLGPDQATELDPTHPVVIHAVS
jgi:glucoamylase